MIIYETLEDGNLRGNGAGSIPPGHRLYKKALLLVEKGEAAINPYIAPLERVADKITELEGSITERWKRTAILGDEYAIKMIEEVEAKINLLRTK